MVQGGPQSHGFAVQIYLLEQLKVELEDIKMLHPIKWWMFLVEMLKNKNIPTCIEMLAIKNEKKKGGIWSKEAN